MWARGKDQKRCQLAIKVARYGAETVLWAYGQPLTNSGSFKYLGNLLSATDDNWSVAVANLQKERKRWTQLSRILGNEGAYT